MTLPDDTAARLVAVLERIERRLSEPASALAVSRRLATLQEARELLGCGRSRLFKLTREKKIVRVLEGLRARWDVESIERYLAGQVVAAGGTEPRRPGRPRKTDAQREAEKIAKLNL